MLQNPRPGRVLPIIAVLVLLITFALFNLQEAVLRKEHSQAVRPFCIAYLPLVLVITSLCGRWYGRLTLLLVAASAMYFLAMPFQSWAVSRPRDRMEIILLFLVGEIVVRSIARSRWETTFGEDKDWAPFADSLLKQAKIAVINVPDVTEVGQCIMHRRGLECFVDLDVYVPGCLPLSEGQVVVARTEAAVRGIYPLIEDVRVRLRTSAF